MHLAEALLARGDEVVGVDNLNDYYEVSLKESRLEQLTKHPQFFWQRLDLADRAATEKLFAENQFDAVAHLAAQAGVRYSLENPHAYIESNIVGFTHILEGCRHHQVGHLAYASSSSVYGANRTMPFAVTHNVDHPVSLYAATKKANELIAHTYSHLYQLPTTGLRFFTVYGPWGRPDMALYKFTRAIFKGDPIDVYNHGKMERDFTYIDDIVDGVVRVIDRPAQADPNWSGEQPSPESSKAPYRVYNIGNNSPVQLMRFIEVLEEAIGKPAEKNLMPMQPGDVPSTYADVAALNEDTGFAPTTPIEVGVPKFVKWYRGYYGV